MKFSNVNSTIKKTSCTSQMKSYLIEPTQLITTTSTVILQNKYF